MSAEQRAVPPHVHLLGAGDPTPRPEVLGPRAPAPTRGVPHRRPAIGVSPPGCPLQAQQCPRARQCGLTTSTAANSAWQSGAAYPRVFRVGQRLQELRGLLGKPAGWRRARRIHPKSHPPTLTPLRRQGASPARSSRSTSAARLAPLIADNVGDGFPSGYLPSSSRHWTGGGNRPSHNAAFDEPLQQWRCFQCDETRDGQTVIGDDYLLATTNPIQPTTEVSA